MIDRSNDDQAGRALRETPPETRIRCPLCEWFYEVPPLDPRICAATLTDDFGREVVLRQALQRQARQIETALQQHFRLHPFTAMGLEGLHD